MIAVVGLAAFAMMSASCGVGGGRMNSDTDSMAYHYGVHIGHNLMSQDSTMNPNLVAKGILDVFKHKTEITTDSATTVLNEYFMVKLPKKKEAAEKVYLESVEKAEGVQKTASGLLYTIIEPGDTAVMPVDADNVVVKYVGRFREGAEFDKTKEGKEFDKNDSISFPLANMIEGWKEGVKLLGKGGKIRMWIPSALGYGQGNQMYGGPMGPFETLVFDVDLMDVVPVAPVVEETVVAE